MELCVGGAVVEKASVCRGDYSARDDCPKYEGESGGLLEGDRTSNKGSDVMAKQIVISGCLSACLLMGLGSLSAASSSPDTKTPSGSLTLSWDAPPPPVRGYKIFYGTKQGGPYDSVIDTGPVPARSVQVYTVRELQPNTRYYFVVRAYNNAGPSSPSNEAVGTAP